MHDVDVLHATYYTQHDVQHSSEIIITRGPHLHECTIQLVSNPLGSSS